MTTDIVVVRHPDHDNVISVFGEARTIEVDIDLGRADLSDPDEWAEWLESRRLDSERVGTTEARRYILSVVIDAAFEFGHAPPDWY